MSTQKPFRWRSRLRIPRHLEALHDGPEILGVKERDDIGLGISTFHVAGHGRKGRHFVVFKSWAPQQIEVLRLIHDSIDSARHLPVSDADQH